MQTIDLKASKREVAGKAAIKALRAEGQVPCIIYGGNEEIALTVSEKDFNKVIYTPIVYLINLSIDGAVRQAIVKDIQFHPVSGKILHADFLEVLPDKPIVIGIPVELTGSAAGVKAGGKLQLEMRKLNVKGLAANVPETLKVDVTELGLGKVIKVGELKYDNIEVLNAKAAVVVAVKMTRAAIASAQAEGKK